MRQFRITVSIKYTYHDLSLLMYLFLVLLHGIEDTLKCITSRLILNPCFELQGKPWKEYRGFNVMQSFQIETNTVVCYTGYNIEMARSF